jgi:predicted membrane protein
MPPDSRRIITPRFIVGVFLVLMGIALTLDQLGVVPAHHLMRYWPAVLIVLGLSILQRGSKHGAVTGVVLVIAGTWLLLNTLGLVSLNLWEFLWPLILVVIGARIMMRSRRSSSVDEPTTPSASSMSCPLPSSSASSTGAGFPDHTSVFSLMSSCRRRWANATFRSAEVTCLMGGCHLDLRNASMGADGTAQIEVAVIMGGINICVPTNWTVVSHVTPLLGGIDDKTRAPPAATQQLILHGTVVMGGIEITN